MLGEGGRRRGGGLGHVRRDHGPGSMRCYGTRQVNLVAVTIPAGSAGHEAGQSLNVKDMDMPQRRHGRARPRSRGSLQATRTTVQGWFVSTVICRLDIRGHQLVVVTIPCARDHRPLPRKNRGRIDCRTS